VLNFWRKGWRKDTFRLKLEGLKCFTTETEEGLKCFFRKGPEKNKEPIIFHFLSCSQYELNILTTRGSSCGSKNSWQKKEKTMAVE
jgi:hypothetical protein